MTNQANVFFIASPIERERNRHRSKVEGLPNFAAMQARTFCCGTELSARIVLAWALSGQFYKVYLSQDG
jgi:hypothetical protein